MPGSLTLTWQLGCPTIACNERRKGETNCEKAGILHKGCWNIYYCHTIPVRLTASTFPSNPCRAIDVWLATDAQRLWAVASEVREGTAIA